MYSKGISWIDDCRIPFVDEVGIKISGDKKHLQKWKEKDGRTQRNINEIENTPYINTKGRFPANILVSDDMLNDGIKPNKGHRAKSKVTGYGEFGGGKNEYHGIGEYMEVDSKSRYYDIDKWFDNLING
jgi:hypothetical protein